MPARRLIALVAVAFGVCAGGAAAAPPWTGEQDVSRAHLFVDPPRAIGFTGGGALTLARWQDGIGEEATTGTAIAVRAPGASAFSPPRPGPAHLVDVAAFGNRFVALLQPSDRRLRIAYGRADGSLGPSRPLASGRRLAGAHIDAAPDGTIAAAWFDDRGFAHEGVRVAVRRPGHGMGRTLAFRTRRTFRVAVAAARGGRAIVVWNERDVVRARVKGAGRASFGGTQTIRSAPAYGAFTRAALDASGRAVVAWSAQRLTEGGSRGPALLEAAVRPAGARRFRRAQLVDRRTPEQGAPPFDLARAPDGRTALAWAAGAELRVAFTDGGDRFGAPQALSVAGREAGGPALAAGPGGWAVVWSAIAPPTLSGDPAQVYAAFAPAAAEGDDAPLQTPLFGPPEPVSEDHEANAGDVVFTDRGLLAAWSERPEGSRPAGGVDAVRTFARVAERPEP
ncbi:MAG TPA: hypothetical protein VF549_14215 [Solirubrobacteraceae bacterium]|jgi:hypothetical protein